MRKCKRCRGPIVTCERITPDGRTLPGRPIEDGVYCEPCARINAGKSSGQDTSPRMEGSVQTHAQALETDAAVLACLRRGARTRKQVAERTGLLDRTAANSLKRLMERGQITNLNPARGRAAVWEVLA